MVPVCAEVIVMCAPSVLRSLACGGSCSDIGVLAAWCSRRLCVVYALCWRLLQSRCYAFSTHFLCERNAEKEQGTGGDDAARLIQKGTSAAHRDRHAAED